MILRVRFCNCCIAETISELINSHEFSIIKNNDDHSEQPCQLLQQCGPLFTDESFDENEVATALKQFGFTSYRSGQKSAIKRILCGKFFVIISTDTFIPVLYFSLLEITNLANPD